MNQYLGRELAMTSKALSAEFDRRLMEAGGSLSTWIVLRSASEWCLSQRELAARMGVEAPTLVHHLDRLEREGLIERCRDPHDRRVIRISVTPGGQRLFATLREVADETQAELSCLLAPDYEVLVGALSRLRAHLKALRGEPEGERETVAHASQC
jgi:MarR family transcriptional regulator for hemolysin